LVEVLLQARDLRLLARRERALDRAQRNLRRGDRGRAERHFQRALRADDRRFELGRLGALRLIREALEEQEF
jgi:hypothetical protein